jgi:uncharacterized membrane protein YcjF (UPF0283 family)
MNTPSSSVAIWESGRLAKRRPSRPLDFNREQWIATALLVLAAIVFAAFVAVLEQDMRRSELQRSEQRARAIAEADCEASRPAESRGACLALFNGDAVAVAQDGAAKTAAVRPTNEAYMQVSTLAGPAE